MPRLFETISIINGTPMYMEYHNARLNRTRKELFGIDKIVDIADYLGDIPRDGHYRAKLIYDIEIHSPIYYIYKARSVSKILIEDRDIEYRYKYLDRDALSYDSRYDEVIYLLDGMLTDSSIANIALLSQGTWYTPATPLLQGTTRARLLDSGQITPRDISVSDMPSYEGLALMNAMIGFKIIKNPIFYYKDQDVTRDISYR